MIKLVPFQKLKMGYFLPSQLNGRADTQARFDQIVVMADFSAASMVKRFLRSLLPEASQL